METIILPTRFRVDTPPPNAEFYRNPFSCVEEETCGHLNERARPLQQFSVLYRNLVIISLRVLYVDLLRVSSDVDSCCRVSYA